MREISIKLRSRNGTARALGGNAAFVFPDQTLEMDYDGLSTHEDSAESYTCNTANGNETQKIQWGQVTGSNNGTFTDTGSRRIHHELHLRVEHDLECDRESFR